MKITFFVYREIPQGSFKVTILEERWNNANNIFNGFEKKYLPVGLLRFFSRSTLRKEPSMADSSIWEWSPITLQYIILQEKKGMLGSSFVVQSGAARAVQPGPLYLPSSCKILTVKHWIGLCIHGISMAIAWMFSENES